MQTRTLTHTRARTQARAIHARARAGWEEVTDASVTYLLRSVLAKGGKDVGAIPHSMQARALA